MAILNIKDEYRVKMDEKFYDIIHVKFTQQDYY